MSGLTLLRQLINLLRDVAFVIIYAQSLPPARQSSAIKRRLGYLCLFATLIMYSAENNSIFSSGIVRTCFRTLCYFIFLFATKSVHWKMAGYYALYLNTICTIVHNLFLTPLTRPILLNMVSYTDCHVLNWLISFLIVNTVVVLCYAVSYYLVPLKQIRTVGAVRICELGILSMGSIYMNATLRIITDQESHQSFELSAYAVILQIALFCCMIFVEQLQYKTQDAFEAKLEAFSTRTMLENIEAQNQNNDRLRQIRHDLKNHLVTVRYLVEQNQRSQCLEYIDRLTDDYTSSRLVIRTGNAVLDNVISVKLNTAVEHDIMVSVTADFSCLRSLSDVDICVIFANLLDNAIEACDRIEKAEERYIDIRSAVQGGQCIFTIQNSYNGCCICDHDEFQTTKPDQLCHGIGIKSVRAAMERSGGILHFEQDEDELIFKTVLIFPEPRFGLN